VQLEQQHAKSWNAGQFLVFLFCSSQFFIIFFYKGKKERRKKWTDTFPNVFTARGKVVTLGLLL
jgi:hypothetical protein